MRKESEERRESGERGEKRLRTAEHRSASQCRMLVQST